MMIVFTLRVILSLHWIPVGSGQRVIREHDVETFRHSGVDERSSEAKGEGNIIYADSIRPIPLEKNKIREGRAEESFLEVMNAGLQHAEYV